MWYYGQFELFRAMHEVRPYRLVLALIRVGDDSVRELNRVLDVEEAKEGLPLHIEIRYTLREY